MVEVVVGRLLVRRITVKGVISGVSMHQLFIVTVKEVIGVRNFVCTHVMPMVPNVCDLSVSGRAVVSGVYQDLFRGIYLPIDPKTKVLASCMFV